YNIANGLPIVVNDPSTEMKLIYIDDVVAELMRILNKQASRVENFCTVEPVYSTTLGRIVEMLGDFKTSHKLNKEPELPNDLYEKLYLTYLSYLPKDQLLVSDYYMTKTN